MDVREPVGVALLGYGYWGANLARNIRGTSRLELIGVVDPNESQRNAALASQPGATPWTDLSDALSDDRVDAIVIAAPAGRHAELARRSIEAGKHVMVEKPLATTVEDANDIVALAADRGSVVMVGHTFLYSPPVWRLKEYIDSGELGTVQYVYSQRLSLGRIRRDCNALWNFAPHDVSIMTYLLGEYPTEVSATSIAVIDPDLPDVFFARLTFPSGISGHLHVSWIDPRKSRLMTVVGDHKMAIYDDVSVDQKLSIVDAGVARSEGLGEYVSLGDFQWRTRAGDILIPKIELTEPLRNEMEAFADACLGVRSTPTDAAHGAAVVSVLAAVDESARRGGSPVQVA